MPAASYTGAFHSASTIRHGPCRLNDGLMPDEIFGPRVSVRRTCAPSRIPFAASVANSAALTSSRDGMSRNAMARAESMSRSRWSSRRKMRPS
jgi:hypothetical protein